MYDLRTDPLAFEALRHRITTVADEGSMVLSMVSSSPVASEANDCNVAIMDASGAAVVVGRGIIGHSIGCMMTARYVRTEYGDNPGIREGDMFLANDPYRCNRHQTCFSLVAPVWWQGELVAWVGAGIHVPDAGGPTPGQISLGAQSIYEEATPMLPMRIVEGGRIRKDLEAEFVVRSRTTQQLSLDLRAMIAACERLSRRLGEMCQRHGADVVTATFEDMIGYNAAHVAARLRQVPDGQWTRSIWLDYPQASGVEYYECRLALTKSADKLTLDFRGSSPQAPAVVNCGEPGLIAGVTTSLMTLLGYGLPLCPEAVLRTVDIVSEPGTFVHALHPAGCSKATTAAQHAVTLATNLAVSEMFLASNQLEDRAIAGAAGFLPITDVEGVNQSGKHFATVLLDSSPAGYAAMSGKDGVDSAGNFGSPYQSIANVETYEARYPMLYLWRRHEPDSGGFGTHRGGMGTSRAFVPHRAEGRLRFVLHGHGCSVPSTPGVRGGHPGSTNRFEVGRGTRISQLLQRGCVPQSEEELGERLEAAPNFERLQLDDGDVLIVCCNGGGGLGDPLERPTEHVAADLAVGAVTPEWAERGYGVVVRASEIDEPATAALRARRRQERVAAARPGEPAPDLDRADDSRCPSCKRVLDARSTLVRETPLRTLGAAVVPSTDDAAFHARQLVCAACGAAVDTVIASTATRDQAWGDHAGA